MKSHLTQAVLASLLALALTTGCSRSSDDNETDTNTPVEDTVTGDDSTVPDEDTSGPGDDTTPNVDVPVASGCGEIGVTVADLQQKQEGLECVPPAEGENGFINLDQGVELNCVVVTAPVHMVTETMDGFFVADQDGGPFSGIKVVVPKGTAPALAVGDVLDLVGDLKEYYCLTEFDATSLTLIADTQGTAEATAVTEADLGKDGDPEQYEGVLVTLSDVTVKKHDEYGGFALDGGLIVDDAVFADMEPIDAGCKYTTVTGVIDYGYGKYKLYPRNADDLVASTEACAETTTTISDIQQSDESLTCTDEAFVNVGEVSLSGVIVATPGFSASDSLDGFFVTDGEGGPYSGLYIISDAGDSISYAVGDVLDLTVDLTEYYCLTEGKIVQHSKTGTFDGELPVAELAPADLAPGVAEQYEGVVVQLTDVEILTQKDDYGQFTVTGDIMVKFKFDAVEYTPVVGDTISLLRGPLTYDFGDYKIMPTSMDDLVVD